MAAGSRQGQAKPVAQAAHCLDAHRTGRQPAQQPAQARQADIEAAAGGHIHQGTTGAGQLKPAEHGAGSLKQRQQQRPIPPTEANIPVSTTGDSPGIRVARETGSMLSSDQPSVIAHTGVMVVINTGINTGINTATTTLMATEITTQIATEITSRIEIDIGVATNSGGSGHGGGHAGSQTQPAVRGIQGQGTDRDQQRLAHLDRSGRSGLQQPLDPPHQLRKTEGLGQIVVGTGGKPLDPVVGTGQTGEDEHGEMVILAAQLFQQVEAIATGKPPIKQQQIRLITQQSRP